jgi:hypothetical protein
MGNTNLVVNLLIEHDDPPVHVKNSDEVGATKVVLHEASRAARSHVPPKQIEIFNKI